MSTPAIEAAGLTKYYGTVRGIEDLDLEVGRGQIFGLLGPNGAGKTTTIRLLLDFIRPTRGSARVLGLDARRDTVEIKRRTGYLPGDLALYEHLTGAEFFEYLARLRGNVERSHLGALVERLSFDGSRKLGALSRGNRQKAGVIQALMHRPDLVLLDEPTAALDPLVQEQVHSLLKEAAAGGATVFLSSHILSEVEHLCERIGIVREGRLTALDSVGELKARAVRVMTIEFSAPIEAAVFDGLPGITGVEARGRVVRCRVVGPLDAVVKTAARFHVLNITTEQPGLEEVFMEYYSGDARTNAR